MCLPGHPKGYSGWHWGAGAHWSARLCFHALLLCFPPVSALLPLWEGISEPLEDPLNELLLFTFSPGFAYPWWPGWSLQPLSLWNNHYHINCMAPPLKVDVLCSLLFLPLRKVWLISEPSGQNFKMTPTWPTSWCSHSRSLPVKSLPSWSLEETLCPILCPWVREKWQY